jgi:hypothetical protein
MAVVAVALVVGMVTTEHPLAVWGLSAKMAVLLSAMAVAVAAEWAVPAARLKATVLAMAGQALPVAFLAT